MQLIFLVKTKTTQFRFGNVFSSFIQIKKKNPFGCCLYPESLFLYCSFRIKTTSILTTHFLNIRSPQISKIFGISTVLRCTLFSPVDQVFDKLLSFDLHLFLQKTFSSNRSTKEWTLVLLLCWFSLYPNSC